MKIDLVISPVAQRDLAEIWQYIAERSGNPEIADKHVTRIREAFSLLIRHPFAGRRRDDLKAGYRSYAKGTEVILYRVYKSSVLIARVIRGGRNIKRDV